jgi:phage pi2 protein 07
MKSKNSKSKSLSVPEIKKEMRFCINNGIKVYPINKNGKWFIQSDVKGSLTTFKKEVSQIEISLAMAKTYIFYYEKYNKKQS